MEKHVHSILAKNTILTNLENSNCLCGLLILFENHISVLDTVLNRLCIIQTIS